MHYSRYAISTHRSSFRELQDGEVFYILSLDASETCHLFRNPNTPFVGGFVAIYEGAKDQVIHNIPVVITKTSLVSIAPQYANIKMNPIIRDLGLNEDIQGFLLEIIRPIFTQSGRVAPCRARFCDSRHSSKVTCPAIASGRTANHALTFFLSAPEHKITNAEYTSQTLMEVFVAPRVLTVSAKKS